MQFIAMLLTMLKILKWSECSSVDEWIKSCGTFTQWNTTQPLKKENKKKGAPTLCDSVDGPGEYYARWSKPVRERQIPYEFTHMWNKMNKIN